MSNLRSLLGAVLVATVVSAAGATQATAADVHTDRCNRKGQRTVALNKVIRVYADSSLVYVACVRRTGKKAKLFQDDGEYTSGSVRTLAGHFVAYEVTEFPGCKADCPPGVDVSHLLAVVDPRTGTTRNLHDGTFWSVRLRASGSVAWLAGSESGTTLEAWTTERKTLDSGDISAVRVKGAELVWTKAGEKFSAPFA